MHGRAPIAILGAGLAGATAADELRLLGYDGDLILIGDEPELPYDRPPLSKDFLRGETSRSGVVLYDDASYAARRIDLRRDSQVVALDLPASQIVLENGSRIRFHKLLLSTGASGARPAFPGAELGGVHVVRTLSDSEALRAALLAKGDLLVIGGGWLGTEIAASARQLGCRVTLAVRDDEPLVSGLGAELGAIYGALHREHGTDVLPRTEIVALEGDGRVRAARTADGRRLEAEVVVFAGGARPRTQLAESGGLRVGRGIIADELLRTTAASVYAAGDVADAWNAFYAARIRAEHWDNAIGQGEAAAAALLGQGRPYDRIPHFFSDQYAAQLAYHGFHAGPPTAVRGRDTAALVAFWQDDADRVVAAAEIDLYGGAHAHGEGQAAEGAGGPGGGEPAAGHAHGHDDDHDRSQRDDRSHDEHHAPGHTDGDDHASTPQRHGHHHGPHAAELQALIRARAPVSRARLLDPAVPLAELAPPT